MNDMTDKERLELAAKAAGLVGEYRHNGYGTGSFVAQSDGCKGGISWNPLTDDGDALRLAVKRKIFHCHMNLFLMFYEEEIANGLDEATATRRAIVRTVVEIGRTL